MKKLFLSVGLVAGLVLAAAGPAHAANPELSAAPSSGGPGFTFDLEVDDCFGPSNVLFTVPGDTDNATCDNDGDTVVSTEFTAPAAPGTYDVTALLYVTQEPPTAAVPDCPDEILTFSQLPCLLTAEITVVVDTTTTTTTTTTTVVETTTTTVPATTTTVPMTTAPAPTTTMVLTPQLPATGGPDASTALFAALLLVLGGGLVVLTRARMQGSTR